MVKNNKKKKSGLSDKLHFKKGQHKLKKQLNPFEVHINKEKFKVLGKKSKNDRGLPGVSRAKAINKRKNTIGFEMKLVNKSNTFLDKRIGEKNVSLTEEQKVMARFAAEQIHQHKSKVGKHSIYNLGEDEILTHRGQTLEEIEKFDDPRSDDEDDEDLGPKKFGHLREDFVSDANFGGGVLSRSDKEDGAKSRKDLIEQLIIESKKRKIEKQKLKEETLDMTEKLDTEWKDLHPVVSKAFNKEDEKKSEPPSLIDKLLKSQDKKNEDYDKTMRELKFEPRGTPSDRLKSEDEIAKIEKDKLDKLEKDRIARMHGIIDTDETKNKNKHRSADDLDDGYIVDTEPELVIAYDSEGKLLMPIDDKLKKLKEMMENDEEDDDSNEGTNSGTEEDESANESEDSLSDLRETSKFSSDEEIETETNKKSILKINESVEENKSKKRVSFALDGDNDHIKNIPQNKTITSCLKKHNAVEAVKETVKKVEDKVVDLAAKKLMMEKAAAELPYTYKMPTTYEELTELLENQPPDYQHIIVERIIKCNHPSLGEGNKQKLGTLFAFLLQHLNDLFAVDNIKTEKELMNAFKCFDRLVLHYYNLAQMDPANAKDCVLGVIREKYDDYKKHEKKIPPMDTIIFFKLVSVLFPTSDLRHPVVTPCFHFMSNILTMVKFKNCIDISRGLFISILILEYTSLSKRFLPSMLNFLAGVLYLCLPVDQRTNINTVPLFKFNESNKELLVLKTKNTESKPISPSPVRFLISDETDDEFKIQLFTMTIKMFGSVFKQTLEYQNQRLLLESHISILKALSIENYPKNVTNLLNTILSDVESKIEKKTLKPLIEENKKPKSIRFYEPSFDNEFSGKKRKMVSKEKLEHEKLVYKHKKEMKGALREIRRDKSYINSVKISEKIRSDNLRKEKVKRIFSDASIQQGELNALQRSKKHKK